MGRMKELAMSFAEREMFTRHGGAYDRGGADAWYGREAQPHYYTGDTYSSARLEAADMSCEEIQAYYAGYEQTQGRKEWE